MPIKTSKKFKQKSGPFFIGICVGLFLFWSLNEGSFFKSFSFDAQPWKQPSKLGDFPLPTTTPILKRTGYALAYDGRTRNALWVYRKLTPDTLIKHAERSSCSFQEDPLLPAHIRATVRDYEGSGFDRGHLSPAADNSSSQLSLQESFYLSNVAPQAPEFNRGYWKRLETHLRSLLKQSSVLHIFTGPLYLAHKGRGGNHYVKYQVIGANEVAVPTHFFTLIFIEKIPNRLAAQGYILPNRAIRSDIPLKQFSATVEQIERASGVVFSKMMVE